MSKTPFGTKTTLRYSILHEIPQIVNIAGRKNVKERAAAQAAAPLR
jgi:hypothetical protein